MWKYRALNKEKEELCIREGIVDGMQVRYRELGDESPLFRWVYLFLYEVYMLRPDSQLCHLSDLCD